MPVSRDEVRRVADLAHLLLTEEEIERMTRDLNAILDFVAALQELDTEGVPAEVELGAQATPLADDHASAFPDPGRILGLSPREAERHYVVPRVIEEGKEEG